MAKATFKVGDRVRDRFKLPRPGEGPECCTGKVIRVRLGEVVVKWDDGRQTVDSAEGAAHLYVKEGSRG